MASTFIAMAWQIALVLSLLSLGAASIYAAWIFTKKYYQLVKDGTAVKEQIDSKFSDLQSELRGSHKNLRREVVREIIQMRKELDEALKRSEVVPIDQAKPEITLGTGDVANKAAAPSTDQVDASSAIEQTASEVTYSAKDETNQTKTQIQDAPKDISNPF